MNWTDLNSLTQIDSLKSQSHSQPVIIFKHSTRCSISSMAKNRMDKISEPVKAIFYYLDLIAHRDISGKVAEEFAVHHESPQVLLIINGECVYEETHNGINAAEITSEITSWANKLQANV